jgi:diguanylate cyclase (GGDEF)-like protein
VVDKISATLRGTDLAGRWAGDEFLLVLPHLDEDGAATLAARLNDHVRNAPLKAEGVELDLQISIGVAQWSGESTSRLIDRADGALYAAKRAGRDTFAIAEDTAPFPLSGPVPQL